MIAARMPLDKAGFKVQGGTVRSNELGVRSKRKPPGAVGPGLIEGEIPPQAGPTLIISLQR